MKQNSSVYSYVINIYNLFKDKEERCRDRFEANGMFMKMPRNPIRGDLTSREDAEFAIPFHHSIMLKMEQQNRVYIEPQSPTKLTRYVDERETTFARPNPLVEDVRRKINNLKQPQLETLKTRASYMDNEIEQMRKLVEFKKKQLASAPGAAVLNLPSYSLSSP